jgi:hypothetical protein
MKTGGVSFSGYAIIPGFNTFEEVQNAGRTIKDQVKDAGTDFLYMSHKDHSNVIYTLAVDHPDEPIFRQLIGAVMKNLERRAVIHPGKNFYTHHKMDEKGGPWKKLALYA